MGAKTIVFQDRKRGFQMDKVMFSKERLLKYIKLGVYRPAQIIFKKLFEIKSRYDHPLGSSDLIGPTRKKPSKYCPIFAVLVSSTNQCVPNHLPKKERNLSLYVFRYFFLQSRT